MTLPVYLNYLFNRLMAPRFAYRFMITEARRDFIAEHYPTILPHYDRLQIGAAQADLWRLLVLHKFGGVYLDIDAHQIWPLSCVLGTETEELYHDPPRRTQQLLHRQRIGQSQPDQAN